MPDRSPVFLDTSGWIEVLHTDDPRHAVAVTWWNRLIAESRNVIASDWIVAETGNGLSRTRARTIFQAAVEAFLASSRCQLVPVDDELLEEALDLYTRTSDKSWGLVDCASFILMRETGCREALTADRHFEQAGFICLLPTA